MFLSGLNLFNQQPNRSSKWKKVRAEHLKTHPSCAACGDTDSLEVHHIEPFSINPDRELDPTNLITLCSKSCHFYIGHLKDYTSWNISVIEDSKVYFNKVSNRPYKIRVTNYEQHSNLFDLMFSWFSCFWRNYRK